MAEDPNRAAAAVWNARSRKVGWADIGEPAPAGWRYEPGWGLTRTVEPVSSAMAVEDEGELAGVEAVPDDPWA
jgi:hypothetical protein